jgi:hypothetical protein
MVHGRVPCNIASKMFSSLCMKIMHVVRIVGPAIIKMDNELVLLHCWLQRFDFYLVCILLEDTQMH